MLYCQKRTRCLCFRGLIMLGAVRGKRCDEGSQTQASSPDAGFGPSGSGDAAMRVDLFRDLMRWKCETVAVCGFSKGTSWTQTQLTSHPYHRMHAHVCMSLNTCWERSAGTNIFTDTHVYHILIIRMRRPSAISENRTQVDWTKHYCSKPTDL